MTSGHDDNGVEAQERAELAGLVAELAQSLADFAHRVAEAVAPVSETVAPVIECAKSIAETVASVGEAFRAAAEDVAKSELDPDECMELLRHPAFAEWRHLAGRLSIFSPEGRALLALLVRRFRSLLSLLVRRRRSQRSLAALLANAARRELRRITPVAVVPLTGARWSHAPPLACTYPRVAA